MTVTQADILSYLSAQKQEFSEQFQVVKLGLFGSFAQGNPTPQSDIDVLIEFQPHTSHLVEKKATIRSLLQHQFQREVDLCREKYIKPYYKEQILKSAIYV